MLKLHNLKTSVMTCESVCPDMQMLSKMKKSNQMSPLLALPRLASPLLTTQQKCPYLYILGCVRR